MFVRFTLLALVAAAAAVPANNRPPFPVPMTDIAEDEVSGPWFAFPAFSKLFAPLFKLFPSFAEIGPKVVVDDDKFQIVMDGLKNYKKDDLKIKTEGPFIFVRGSHEVKQDEHDLIASQFFHTYSLPENASSADVTATLSSDGVLVITAPLKGPVDRTKEEERVIPIVETGKPYVKEDKEASDDKTTVAATVPPAPTTAAPEDDRKEATTPEDATEKDNVIPHGNEINP